VIRPQNGIAIGARLLDHPKRVWWQARRR
jgi:hypothetical protein